MAQVFSEEIQKTEFLPSITESREGGTEDLFGREEGKRKKNARVEAPGGTKTAARVHEGRGEKKVDGFLHPGKKGKKKKKGGVSRDATHLGKRAGDPAQLPKDCEKEEVKYI